jgi:hypothetical protein
VRIPLKKEKPRLTTVTIHDTVTVVRTDTVRIVRVDTLFRTDTLRDSCSRAVVPFPGPIPVPVHREREVVSQGATESLSVAPEPGTIFLVGSGLAGLTLLAYFRRGK